MDDEKIVKLGLPVDVVLKYPYLFLCGNKKMMIQNHRGILQFQNTKILIRCEKYKIEVNGSDFEIVSYTEHEIIICGYIKGITFLYG